MLEARRCARETRSSEIVPEIAPAGGTESQAPVVVNHNRRADGIESVGYAGALTIASSFTPSEPCDAIVRALAPTLPAVQRLDFIVEDCKQIARSRLLHLPSGITRLSDDEALAAAVYSYDLGMSSDPAMDGADNFYVQLNEKLRERDSQTVRALRPYLYYLFQALDKLPKMEGVVLRGIPASSLATVQAKYTQGKEIVWSAFTSTTVNPRTAKVFAGGSGGIIFRVTVLEGRVIKAYSAIQVEDEVLLKPNTKFIVSRPCYRETNGEFTGFYVVEMLEVAGKFIF